MSEMRFKRSATLTASFSSFLAAAVAAASFSAAVGFLVITADIFPMTLSPGLLSSFLLDHPFLVETAGGARRGVGTFSGRTNGARGIGGTLGAGEAG